MLLDSLEIFGFRVHKHLRFEFGGDWKAAVLVGSNGAGKSSILDALYWCLWGEVPGFTLDELINEDEEDMKVILWFSIGKRQYVVQRYKYRGRQTELSLWINDKPYHGGIREVQSFLVKTIGIDAKLFRSTTYMSQEELDLFSRMTGTERLETLMKLLRLDLFSKLEEYVKNQIDQMNLELASERERLKGLKEDYKEGKRANKRLGEVKIDLAHIDANLEDLREESKRLQKRLEGSSKQVLKDLRERIREREERHEDRIEQARDRIKNIDGALARLESISDIESDIEKAEAEVKRLTKAVEKNGKINKRLEKVKGQAAVVSAKITQLKDDLEALESKVDVLEGETECPTCGSEIDPESLEKHIRKEIEEVKGKLEKAREQNRGLQEKRTKLSKQLEAGADMKLSSAIQRVDVLKQKLIQVESSEDQLVENKAEAEEELEKAAAEYENDKTLKKLKRDYQKRKRQGESYSEIEERYDEVLDEISQLEEDRDETIKELGEVQSLVRIGKAAKKEGKWLSQEIKAKQAELADLEDLKEIYSKRGAPEHMVKRSLPMVELRANKILEDIGAGYRIEFKERRNRGFDIVIVKGSKKRGVHTFSGGEKARINLACRMGVNQFVHDSRGLRMPLVFIDEATSPMDEKGKIGFMNVINDLARKTNYKILVVTHDHSLVDRFDKVIRVDSPETEDGYDVLR